MIRTVTSRIGASTPTLAYVGSRPIANVASPITTSDNTSTGLRPTRSPRWPPRTPPSGRAANPTPNVANAASVPVIGFAPGKNAVPKYNAAAVPNPMKS